VDGKWSSDNSINAKKKANEKAVVNLELMLDESDYDDEEDEEQYNDIQMVRHDDVVDEMIEFVEDESDDIEELL